MANKFDNMSMADLRKAATEAGDVLSKAQDRLAEILAEVSARTAEKIEAAYLKKGDDAGTARIKCEGIPIKVTKTRRVEWDQLILAKAIKDTKSGLANVIEAKLSISSDNWKKLDDKTKKFLKKARAEKIGKPSIDFEIKV